MFDLNVMLKNFWQIISEIFNIFNIIVKNDCKGTFSD